MPVNRLIANCSTIEQASKMVCLLCSPCELGAVVVSVKSVKQPFSYAILPNEQGHGLVIKKLWIPFVAQCNLGQISSLYYL